MSENIASIDVTVEAKHHSMLVDLFIRLVKEKPLGTFGGILVAILLFVGIFANILAPYGINKTHVADCLAPPSAEYLLGTDNLGRDVMSRIIYGARISMYVGLGGAILSTVVSVVIGLVSGYFGGKIDTIVQRFVDAWMCFPPLVIYLTVMSILGPGMLQVILVLGIHRGITQSRVVRSAVMGVKENIYVQAAGSIGCTNTKILIQHVLPNIMAPIIILFTVASGFMILQESTLSFLGFGIPPPTPSWGGMLSGAGREFMLEAPWMVLWPGLALSLAVYGINMLGDGVRDILDPRMRGGLGRYGGVKVKLEKVNK